MRKSDLDNKCYPEDLLDNKSQHGYHTGGRKVKLSEVVGRVIPWNTLHGAGQTHKARRRPKFDGLRPNPCGDLTSLFIMPGRISHGVLDTRSPQRETCVVMPDQDKVYHVHSINHALPNLRHPTQSPVRRIEAVSIVPISSSAKAEVRDVRTEDPRDHPRGDLQDGGYQSQVSAYPETRSPCYRMKSLLVLDRRQLFDRGFGLEKGRTFCGTSTNVAVSTAFHPMETLHRQYQRLLATVLTCSNCALARLAGLACCFP